MDFDFSEDQRILMDMARKFLDKEVPKTLVQELIDDEKGYSPEIWKKIVELGWTGLAFDEEYGGYGGSFIDLAVIFEEMGRAAVPTPFFASVVLSGILIQDCGSTEIKKKYLPAISEGECMSTLALVGRSGVYGKNDVELQAERSGDGYRLNGSAFFVPYAHVADTILCAAKMSSEDGGGVTLFMADGDARGMEATPLKTIAGNGNECVLNVSNMEVPQEQIVGEVGKGWDYIENLLPKISVLLSCECVGGMDKITEMTISHVNERIQFGKPLSSFQVVQHMCVDLFTKAKLSRYAAYHAAWLISEGLEFEKEAAVAKAWCGEAYKDASKLAHQVTGAIGFTEEYDLHFYTRNAKKLEVLFGNGSFHRRIVADKMGL